LATGGVGVGFGAGLVPAALGLGGEAVEELGLGDWGVPAVLGLGDAVVEEGLGLGDWVAKGRVGSGVAGEGVRRGD